MNPPLPDLYPPVVLAHGRRPHNRGVPAGATHHAKGDNPLCGDHLGLHLRMDGQRIGDIGFDGVCCMVATASASLMTRAVLGRDLAQAQALGAAFDQLMAGVDPATLPDLGELAALAAVGGTGARAQCAGLAWQALATALRAVAASSKGVRTAPAWQRAIA